MRSGEIESFNPTSATVLLNPGLNVSHEPVAYPTRTATTQPSAGTLTDQGALAVSRGTFDKKRQPSP